jgi:hypothetical protein
MQLTIGCDPEFFLKKGRKHVSAHDVVPGNKRNPFGLVSGGAVQADGTAVEFNIQPAISPRDFALSIERDLASIRALVPKDLEFDFSPSIVYPKDYFDALPKVSKELGCDPDFNAYTERRNQVPEPPRDLLTMRTGAGHIHIGWTKDADVGDRSHFWDCCTLVKALDSYFEKAQQLWDKDIRRQRLYGARGSFRPKPYGCEYRVLSNAWLKHPKLWPWLFRSVEFVFNQTLENNDPLYYNYYNIWEWNVAGNNQYLRGRYGKGVPLIPEDFNGN